MRTTVGITDDQRVALAALAGRRGLRGFSAIVREAIDRYLAEEGLAEQDLAERDADRADDADAVLALRGVLTEDEADEVQRRIDALRDTPSRGP